MKKFKASLLLECSIGLFLIGLILSVSLQFFKVTNYERKRLTTESRYLNIKTAIEAYVVRNGFMPCAAIDENGIASEDCFNGYVPYKTLGILESSIRDGDGNLFQFIVNENLTCSYHLKNNKMIVPFFLPTKYVYNNDTVSWHRLYKFKEPYIIYDYDSINWEKNIKLYKDDNPFHLSILYCERPILPKLLYEDASYDEEIILEFDKYRKLYKVYDLPAWCLVAGKEKISNSKKINLNKDVFFQTRFGMASLCKNSINTNGTYLSYIDHLIFELKEEA